MKSLLHSKSNWKLTKLLLKVGETGLSITKENPFIHVGDISVNCILKGDVCMTIDSCVTIDQHIYLTSRQVVIVFQIPLRKPQRETRAGHLLCIKVYIHLFI